MDQCQKIAIAYRDHGDAVVRVEDIDDSNHTWATTDDARADGFEVLYR